VAGSIAISSTQAMAQARYFEDATPFPRVQPRKIAKIQPVIVIDPGHGGYDPGAIGKKGTQEKVITYEAAQELRALLVDSGKYKVIITRRGDQYISHEERLRLARVGGADLFISIHADSTKNLKIGFWM